MRTLYHSGRLDINCMYTVFVLLVDSNFRGCVCVCGLRLLESIPCLHISPHLICYGCADRKKVWSGGQLLHTIPSEGMHHAVNVATLSSLTPMYNYWTLAPDVIHVLEKIQPSWWLFRSLSSSPLPSVFALTLRRPQCLSFR